MYSRTPDRVSVDFTHHVACVIFLYHTPVPALWKDKKEQSHDGGTWICDVIVMLKGRHHVTSQRIQDFQVCFFSI